jgi:xanthine dehydrogenase YagR molybdenum-binding subunit
MSEWPKETKYIGKSTPRVDGAKKVSGVAKYSHDVQPDGWLFGAILRSSWPAATITAVDLSAALKVRGVKAAILVREGERQVRYYGDEIAAVAATSKQAAFDALRAIKVTAVPRKHVVREHLAARADAPRVFDETPNVGQPRERKNGDVDKGFAEADVVVEGLYATQVEIHQPMETHGGVASFKDGELTAWHSTQGISSVRDGLAGALELPQNKVRVMGEFMGGGFGSKFSAGVEGMLAARLSQAAGAPVRLMLTRFDESLAAGNRPSTFQKIRLGAKADGTLTAFTMDSYGCAGYAAGGPSAGGATNSGFPAPYIYRVPNSRSRHAEVSIHAGPAAAFRAPGCPPASFGIESIMDELALKLSIDPVELRIKNDPMELRQKQYRIAAERFGWAAKYRKPGSSPGPVKVGVGCAGSAWRVPGGGTQAEIEVSPDGSVEIRCGTQDLGTGTHTVIAVVAAELLGLTPADIQVRIADSRFPPSGASGGSMTVTSVTPAIFDACTKAIEELKKSSGLADVRGPQWKAACRKLGVAPLVVQGRWIEGLSAAGTGGVQMAEVEVDTETGFVRVRRVTCVQDAGLLVNKLTAHSQANGGIMMGIGYALYENRVMDTISGVMLNPNFETYKLPGIADVPEIDIEFMDLPERRVMGIGEPVTIPTASAIANAVANAIGARVTSLPITPDKVLAALGKVPGPAKDNPHDAWMSLFATQPA